MRGMDPKVAEDWKDQTPDQRAEFFKDSHELVGGDLAAAIQVRVKEVRRTNFAQSFRGTGKFFDEDDLRDKYKNKPEQLANVLANAKAFQCPIRDVKLFEETNVKHVLLENIQTRPKLHVSTQIGQ